MSLDEARLIAQHADAGRLETDDARIAREVGSVRRRLVRAEIYGRDRVERSRTAAAIALTAAGILVFAGGIALALLVR